MIRVLAILATVVALAVSAAPVASAGSSKKPPPRTAQVVVLIGANDYGLVAKPPPRSLGAANEVSTLSLRKAPAKPGSFIEIGTTETLDMNLWAWHEAARTGIVGKPKPGAVRYNGHAGLGANTKALTGTEAAADGYVATTPRGR